MTSEGYGGWPTHELRGVLPVFRRCSVFLLSSCTWLRGPYKIASVSDMSKVNDYTALAMDSVKILQLELGESGTRRPH